MLELQLEYVNKYIKHIKSYDGKMINLEFKQNIYDLISSYKTWKKLSEDSGIEIPMLKNIKNAITYSNGSASMMANGKTYQLFEYINAIHKLSEMCSNDPRNNVHFEIADWGKKIIKKGYTVRIRKAENKLSKTSIVANDDYGGATSMDKTFNVPVATADEILNSEYIPHFYNRVDV
ncbi:hypothetical protein DY037_05740 [Apilactobacillus micheneri]|uniref:hypothetical protein n=1 Tax=Apilactobacillus micheneri TaxID=1899430 RepID=UPI00112E34C1|nr:hypothetical protein [Apilactobacillus micheneri]TPR49283.1 hypothetical protein DY037_05740 [Apilactobacillus micheneri]